MAHEVETMFTAREIPWHRLGTVVPEAVRSDEAIVLAGLDWEVTLDPVFDAAGNEIGGYRATTRDKDSEVLGIVGERYHVIQNADMFEFVDSLVEYGARYESAGSLRGGKVIFATMVVEDPLVIAGDVHIPYLVIAGSHDASMANRAMLTPIKVVCANTLNLAIRSASRSFTIRHTRSAMSRIEEARRALDVSWRYYDGFEEEVRTLVDQKVTDKEFDALIEAVWPEVEEELKGTRVQRKREGVKAMYLHDDSVGDFRGTGWGALNAFNTWEQWEAPIRRTKNTSDNVGYARSERQALNVLRDASTVTDKVHKLLVAAR